MNILKYIFYFLCVLFYLGIEDLSQKPYKTRQTCENISEYGYLYTREKSVFKLIGCWKF